MMAHNEAYKNSIDIPDELYQESMMPNGDGGILQTEAIEEEPMNREAYQVLNPASTTSSLEQVDMDRTALKT